MYDHYHYEFKLLKHYVLKNKQRSYIVGFPYHLRPALDGNDLSTLSCVHLIGHSFINYTIHIN